METTTYESHGITNNSLCSAEMVIAEHGVGIILLWIKRKNILDAPFEFYGVKKIDEL